VTQPVGIYGKKKTLDTVLRERDRIEIYRPLVADPKDSRRKRAAKKTGPAAGPAPVADPA
jgi:putative ubiquitin-RnfH superfamily antitoxin RatB of RatAB toxin-antitoxin module